MAGPVATGVAEAYRVLLRNSASGLELGVFLPKSSVQTNIGHIGTCFQSCHTAEVPLAVHPTDELIVLLFRQLAGEQKMVTPLICRTETP